MADNKNNQAEELEALKAENENLKAQITAQETLLKELTEELAIKDEEVKNSGKYPVFEYKGKSYDLVIPKSKTRLNDKMVEVTAKSLKEDEKLLAHCIKNGYGNLVERKKEDK